MIMTVEFWKSAGEAAIKAAAAAALGVIGADQLISAMSIDWSAVGGVALLASIVSVLTSVVVPTPEVRTARRVAAAVAAKAPAKAEAGTKKSSYANLP